VPVLLHGNQPGSVVKCHAPKTEIFLAADLRNLVKKGIEVGCRFVVHISDEPCRLELYVR